MVVFVDHYAVLGVSSVEGLDLTEEEISKEFKKMALKLHPDKNPDNPNANSDFQQLLSSYEILKHPMTRRQFHDVLFRQRLKKSRQSSKKHTMQKPPKKYTAQQSSKKYGYNEIRRCSSKKRSAMNFGYKGALYWTRMNELVAAAHCDIHKWFDQSSPFYRI